MCVNCPNDRSKFIYGTKKDQFLEDFLKIDLVGP